MCLLTVHFDDSGTHEQSNIAVAACYASSIKQWIEFERNWNELREREEFDVFHMADFAAGAGEFKGWDSERKRRVLSKVCSIINVRSLAGEAFSVTKKEYDELVRGDARQYFGMNHYTFAVRQCASRLGQWRNRFHRNDSMRYVFDWMSRGKGEIISVMDWAIGLSRGGEKRGIIPALGGYSFEHKEQIVPLQAADVLAWTSFRQMECHVNKKKPGWIADMALKLLLVNNKTTKGSYITRSKLKEFLHAENDFRVKSGYRPLKDLPSKDE
jgi:hypothetical protein